MNEILENNLGIKSLVVRQFIIYGLVALIPTFVDFSLIYLLTEFMGVYYMYSLVIAFVIASVVSYLSQKRFTFRNESKKYANQLVIFFSISLVGLLINAGIVFGTVECLGLWYIFGKIAATAVTYVWNFFAHKQITFKKFE
ncbi:MAG: GtrA family protein [Patescibacteria group bacterium]|nr:GtrA family protein [Patescibacteria group bacterium]